MIVWLNTAVETAGEPGQATVEWIAAHPGEAILITAAIGIVGLAVPLMSRRRPLLPFALLWLAFIFLLVTQLLSFWDSRYPKPLGLAFTGVAAAAVLSAPAAGLTGRALRRRLTRLECGETVLHLLSAFSGRPLKDVIVDAGDKAAPLPAVSAASGRRRRLVLWLAGAMILLAAVPIRLWRLDEHPRHFFCEYAESGSYALDVLESGTPFLCTSLASPVRSSSYLLFIEKIHLLLVDAWAALFALFGISITVMKILPTVLGLACVPAVWAFGRRWIGRGAGEAAAVLFASSPYTIGLSRHLWTHLILTVLYALVAFYLLLLAQECLDARPAAAGKGAAPADQVRSPRRAAIIAACAAATMSLYQYRAAYIVLPIAAFFFGVQFIAQPQWRRRALMPLLAGAGLSLILAAPFIIYFFQNNYASYLGTSAVSADRSRSAAAYLNDNTLPTLGRLFYLGSDHLFPGITESVGYSGHLHLPPVSALFVLGLGAALWSLPRRRTDQVLVLWLVLSAVPSLFSILPPPRRLIMAVPVVYLLAGRGAAGLLGWLMAFGGVWWRRTIGAGALVLAVLLVSVGWGAFVNKTLTDLSPDRELQEARLISGFLKTASVINLTDFVGMQDMVRLLSWNDFHTKQLRRRWKVMPFPGALNSYTLPGDLPTTQIVIVARPPVEGAERGDYIHALRRRFASVRAHQPLWRLEFHYDDQHPARTPDDLMMLSLSLPREQWEAGRRFALQNLAAWLPDSSMILVPLSESPAGYRHGLLRREGTEPLWHVSHPAGEDAAPCLDFLYSDDEKPFKSPHWIWWRGRLRVPVPGVWTFALESDDGSDLWLNGRKIVDNMGDHAMRRAVNAVTLQRGFYLLEIRYYDRVLGAGLKVMVKGPLHREFVPLPREWLFCRPQEAGIPWDAK